MNYEPIIKNKMMYFKQSYGIENLDDNETFEQFVNNLVLRSHQPEAFTTVNDLFNDICVGGQNDMGIDGIAIKVNGIFISSKSDIDTIIKNQKKITIEFIFIQSKYKNNLDSGEFGKFIDGVVDFLSDINFEPKNDKISYWLDLKKYLFDDEIIIRWNTSPNVKMYYAFTGKWTGNEHIEAKAKRAFQEILNFSFYNEPTIRYLDCQILKSICDDIENQYSAVINVLDSFEINEVNEVESSRIVLCNADEFIKILLTDEYILRKSLFTDNVRDFQGNTDINNEIYKTIKNNPDSFSLLNNGITIVCKSMIAGNRKISMENPQIVNGCQTCNVLFNAYKSNDDLSKVSLVVKVIATQNDNITNSIIKGTNRQNIVYDEVFEITRDFHKDLESFFNEINDIERIYYERRSNQYLDNPKIKAIQKINFKILIQSFITIFLSSPHDGFIHESTLLEKYRDKIFIDGQSFYQYYCAAKLYINLDKLFRSDKEKYKSIMTYKNQILCIIVEKMAGIIPDINDSKKIDICCKKIIDSINNVSNFTNIVDEAIQTFLRIRTSWISVKGIQYKYSIKDNQDFTKFMLTILRGGDPNKLVSQEVNTFRGTVVTIKKDRNNLNYGYIKKSPDDVFIHEDDNPMIRFSDLIGKDVVYSITGNSKYGIPRGKITYVVPQISN